MDGQSIGFALKAMAKDRMLQQNSQSTEIVWTGPLVEQSGFRRTGQALLQLINSAAKSITVASFAIYKISLIQDALIRAAQRGVEIRIILESHDEGEGKVTYDMARTLGDEVVGSSSVFIWPREIRETDARGNYGSLHIKCLLVDNHSLFISSANLTDYALNLNMEMGVLITRGNLPADVNAHFDRLIRDGVLRLWKPGGF